MSSPSPPSDGGKGWGEEAGSAANLSPFQQSPNATDAPGLIFPRQFMLPNPQHAPAAMAQGARHQPVAFLVGRELFQQERPVVRGQVRVLWTTVPEAAIDKDDHSLLAEREIGPDPLSLFALSLARGNGRGWPQAG